MTSTTTQGHGTGDARRRGRARALVWLGALALLLFAAWSTYVVVTVSRLRREVEQRVGWLSGLQAVQTRLLAGEAPATVRPDALPVLAPLSDLPDDAIATAARTARRALADEQPQAGARVAEVALALRTSLRDLSIRLGGFWSALNVTVGGALAFGALALALLAAVLRRNDDLRLTRTALADEVGARAAVARRLAAEQAELEAILGSLRDGVIAVDAEGTVRHLNRAAERLIDRAAADTIGRSLERVLALDASTTPPALDVATLRARLHLGAEAGLRVGDRPVALTAAPSEDGAVVVLRDVTTERARREAQAAAARLGSVGAIAAGVAHEINDPLAYVTTNLAFARRTLARQPLPEGALDEVDDALTEAAVGVDRATAIVRDLRAVALPNDRDGHPLEVTPVVERSLRMAAASVRHRATLERAFAPAPPVHGTEAGLGQAVLNLVLNAAKALPDEGGRVRVSVGTTGEGEALVEVQDDGCGMPPELQRRIFEPFFTTRADGDGHGLGLAITRRTIEEMGGRIEVDSTPGEGTRMRLILPPSAESTRVTPLPRAETPSRRRRVLVVDDEPALGRALRRSLRDHHDVEIAGGADEAERRLLAEDFDVVVCDLLMPGRDGIELFEALVARDPRWRSRFLFMTGGTVTARTESFRLDMPRAFIDKPFSPAALLTALNARLGERDRES
ncbi:MAG: response regulator [Myxococcales bacterium]|nr:response regulator [Myxococcales bacterium]